MAKQDVINAINSTIVPNGSKAINADSLRNLLIMMTENAGEGGSSGGSGDGALRVMVPADFMGTGETTTFTPEYWDELKVVMDAEMPGIADALSPVYAEMFAHNAAVYQQLLEKGSNKEGVLCLIDASASYAAAFGVVDELYGITIESLLLSTSEPSRAYVSVSEPADALTPNSVYIKPLNPVDDEGHGEVLTLGNWGSLDLHADGSMTLYPKDTVIYVPSADDQILSESHKAVNASVSLYHVTEIKFVTTDGSTFSVTGNVLARDVSNNILFYAVTNALSVEVGALTIYKVRISSDGSVTNTLVSNLVTA